MQKLPHNTRTLGDEFRWMEMQSIQNFEFDPHIMLQKRKNQGKTCTMPFVDVITMHVPHAA